MRHASGKFFTVQGYHGTGDACPDTWQPLINQPETGTQGYVVRKFDDGYELLVQARTEPGNVGLVQIGPTIQATYSNYTAVHQGKRQPFLELFHHPDQYDARVLVDTVQPELGSKFLKKWNRNIIIESPGLADFNDPMFTWVSLKTLTRLMRVNHLVNNDARLVVGLLALCEGSTLFEGAHTEFGELIRSSFESIASKSFGDVSSATKWLDEIRSRSSLHVEEMALADLPGWQIGENKISHTNGHSFSVIQVKVHASDREVSDWDQPLIAAEHTGQIILICREFEGRLNVLLHAESQIGNAHGAQLHPTFAFDNEDEPAPPSVISELLEDNRILNRFTVEASDEGGRFYQYITRYEIRWMDSDVDPELPSDYCWLSLGQIRSLMDHVDAVSDEARSVLSLLLAAAYCGQFDQELLSRDHG